MLLFALAVLPAMAQDGDDGADVAAGAPFTFDNTACPAFLTGVWLANSQQDVAPGPDQALWHVTEAMVFNADGVLEHAFASGVAGDEPEETKTFGTWLATPGPAKDRCAVTFTFEEGERRASEVVVTAETRMSIDGQAFTRAR
ncbi:MAG: hypothetical protein QM698_12215 [Micropepsaceae bacterium]